VLDIQVGTYLEEEDFNCFLHVFLHTHLRAHSWFDIACHRVGTYMGTDRRTDEWTTDCYIMLSVGRGQYNKDRPALCYKLLTVAFQTDRQTYRLE